MTWESNNLFYKKELWFLQTHLTTSEIKFFKLFLSKNSFSKVTIIKLLEKFIKKSERLSQLLNFYEEFCFTFH